MPSSPRAVLALILIAGVSVGCSTRDATGPNASTTAGTSPAPVTAATAGPTRAPASGSTASTAASAVTAPARDANVVTVKTFQFKPTPITVRAGSPIVWQNQDEITHEPTSGRPGQVTSAFAAVTLDGAGSSGSVTIATPGTYPYFCAVHESMHGEIVVT